VQWRRQEKGKNGMKLSLPPKFCGNIFLERKSGLGGDSREGDFMDNFIGFEEKNKISAL